MSAATPNHRPSSSSSSKQLNDYVCLFKLMCSLLSNSSFQQLGDSLGKGAFGQVYRERSLFVFHLDVLTSTVGALNWATGETVAVKEIQLSNYPKAELGEIMVRPLTFETPQTLTDVKLNWQSEIDLLKNLIVGIAAICFAYGLTYYASAASQHRKVQGFREDERISLYHPGVRVHI